MQSQRMKVRHQKRRMKENLVKAMMKILLKPWKT